MALHRDNESRRKGDNRQNVGGTLTRIHSEASKGLYYVNHMLTKRKLYKHELDEAITVLEKAVSDLKSLKEYHYGDV
jgi:hypothetical protein